MVLLKYAFSHKGQCNCHILATGWDCIYHSHVLHNLPITVKYRFRKAIKWKHCKIRYLYLQHNGCNDYISWLGHQRVVYEDCVKMRLAFIMAKRVLRDVLYKSLLWLKSDRWKKLKRVKLKGYRSKQPAEQKWAKSGQSAPQTKQVLSANW